MQMLSRIHTTSGTNINKNEVDKIFGLSSVYQAVGKITAGAVSQLRQPLPVWDKDTLIAIGDQRIEGLIEILPQLSKEVRHWIISEVQSSLQKDSQGEDRNAQESMLPDSDSGMERAERAERIMQSILSKPQKKTDFFRMAGAFKDLTSLDGE